MVAGMDIKKIVIALSLLLSASNAHAAYFGEIASILWGGSKIVNVDEGTCVGKVFTLASICSAGTSYCTAKLPSATTPYQVSSSGGMRVKSMRVTNTNQFANSFNIAYGTTSTDGTSAPTGVQYYASSTNIALASTNAGDGVWNELPALNFVVPNNDYLFFVDSTTGAGTAFFQVCLQ